MQTNIPIDAEGSKTVSFRIPVSDYARLETEAAKHHLTCGALAKMRAFAGEPRGELGAIELRGRIADLEKHMSRIQELEAIILAVAEQNSDMSKHIVLLRSDLLLSTQALLMVGGWSEQQARAWVQQRLERSAP